jgi:hypothetical protein
MSTTTQYQVTDRILTLAQNHQLVNQVRYGFLSDIDINFQPNPITFYLIPDSATYPRENIIRYRFIMYAWDVLLPDDSNLQAIISDTTSVLNDIYTKLIYNSQPDSWVVIAGGSYRYFKESLKDVVAGAALTIDVETFADNCTQNLPFN